MKNDTGINEKWQQVIDRIPPPYNRHFSGSKAEMSTNGLIISLPSPGANTEQISKRLEPKYIKPKVRQLFGDVDIHYQKSLPSMPKPDPDSFKVINRKKKKYFQVENELYRNGHAARMKPLGLTIYLCLTMHADYQTGECWPSYATLAELCGMSKRSAQNYIKSLEELGYIQIKKSFLDNGSQTSNTIYILEYPIL